MRKIPPRPKPYDLTTHDGKRMDWLTKAALMKMERILGYELSVTQGCYKGLSGDKVKASGDTHDKGGVVDLPEWDWQSKVRAGRLCGFVAYHRPKLVRADGTVVWNGHIHMVQESNKKLDPSARRQCYSYHRGRNGLADDGPDPHPGLVFRGFTWPYAGPVGYARWVRDNLPAKERKSYLAGLRKVARGK